MSIEEVWAKRPTDTYYAVYGALGDSADGDIEDWCRDAMLMVHVAACEEYVFVEPTTVDPSLWIPCGQEDMYCDNAKEILELNRGQENHD